jgi:hypothetical protein
MFKVGDRVELRNDRAAGVGAVVSVNGRTMEIEGHPQPNVNGVWRRDTEYLVHAHEVEPPAAFMIGDMVRNVHEGCEGIVTQVNRDVFRVEGADEDHDGWHLQPPHGTGWGRIEPDELPASVSGCLGDYREYADGTRVSAHNEFKYGRVEAYYRARDYSGSAEQFRAAMHGAYGGTGHSGEKTDATVAEAIIPPKEPPLSGRMSEEFVERTMLEFTRRKLPEWVDEGAGFDPDGSPRTEDRPGWTPPAKHDPPPAPMQAGIDWEWVDTCVKDVKVGE